MSEPWQNIETSKATVDVEKELYKRVKEKFHYGQLTKLFRNIFESLDDIIESDDIESIIHYIYKRNSLTLIPSKENSDES